MSSLWFDGGTRVVEKNAEKKDMVTKLLLHDEILRLQNLKP